MSHRSCAALSPLKSSFQLVICTCPHNNPGNCWLRDQASCSGGEMRAQRGQLAWQRSHSTPRPEAGKVLGDCVLNDGDRRWGIPSGCSPAACCSARGQMSGFKSCLCHFLTVCAWRKPLNPCPPGPSSVQGKKNSIHLTRLFGGVVQMVCVRQVL